MSVFILIDKKGYYEFGKYQCGFFAIEYNSPAVGKTIIFTEDENKAREEFNKLTNNIG